MGMIQCLLFSLAAFGAFSALHADDARPNILWITCEDISPYLGSYGCEQAQTPHLDQLAQDGIRFTHAYANAPVCAVARSVLLTGMHASSIGTQHMRSDVQLPASIPAYPEILQQAGYYCTNNSKTDYNTKHWKTVWNESGQKAHYKNRKDGQPFFAVFNFNVTHESQINPWKISKFVANGEIPKRPRVDLADVTLPPFHPDTPEVREDWARLHDLITRMDEMVGEQLKELEDLGLADDTIVFFYSDHGGQLARTKRYIYNNGTQVPLIVSFPKKWQHLAPKAPGSTMDELVSFIDIPKTAIALTGASPSDLMQGRIFMGPSAEPAPETVHFYRDRMSERYDFSRANTDGRFYYIRNFNPHRPRGRDITYGFKVQANWRSWEQRFAAGECDAVQSQFFQPKPPVQFFDTLNDPWHINNLAEDPHCQSQLQRLERDLDQWMVATRDAGLIPEPMFYDLVGPKHDFQTIYEYAQSERFPVERLLNIAKVASLGDPQKVPDYISFMKDAHPVARYWGAYGVFLSRANDAVTQASLKEMIATDAMAVNRLMAAQALGLCGDPTSAYQAIYKEACATPRGYVFLFALNAFQYSHTDDQLTLEDWKLFEAKSFTSNENIDWTGVKSAQLMIKTAMALWPDRAIVD